MVFRLLLNKFLEFFNLADGSERDTYVYNYKIFIIFYKGVPFKKLQFWSARFLFTGSFDYNTPQGKLLHNIFFLSHTLMYNNIGFVNKF